MEEKRCVTYETTVAELFERFPPLLKEWKSRFATVGDERPPYVVFGSLLIPALEEALAAGNLGSILKICAFLEDAAEASRVDDDLAQLLRVEFGEWLGGAANEASLAPWLGPETKRICGYVPGLATQRRTAREEQFERGIGNRLSRFFRQIVGK
jgi:hypothetical protein